MKTTTYMIYTYICRDEGNIQLECIIACHVFRAVLRRAGDAHFGWDNSLFSSLANTSQGRHFPIDGEHESCAAFRFDFLETSLSANERSFGLAHGAQSRIWFQVSLKPGLFSGHPYDREKKQYSHCVQLKLCYHWQIIRAARPHIYIPHFDLSLRVLLYENRIWIWISMTPET